MRYFMLFNYFYGATLCMFSSRVKWFVLMVCKLLCKNIFPNYTASSKASMGQLHLGSASIQLCNFLTPEPDKIRSK